MYIEMDGKVGYYYEESQKKFEYAGEEDLSILSSVHAIRDLQEARACATLELQWMASKT